MHFPPWRSRQRENPRLNRLKQLCETVCRAPIDRPEQDLSMIYRHRLRKQGPPERGQQSTRAANKEEPMRRTHLLVDQTAEVRGRAAMLIRTSLLTFAAVTVAMTYAVRPASAVKQCVKWIPLTQSQKCVKWAEVASTAGSPTHLPSDSKKPQKGPCNFGQKC
jgi:hypothetical protein